MKRHWIRLGALTLLLTLAAGASQARGLEPQAGAYIVNSDADTPDGNPGDGICDTGAWLDYCTLHAAIQEANLDGVDSTISFASPMNISYPTLPTLTGGGTIIDASNRWDGVWPNGRPGVSVGGNTPVLTIQADGCVVRGIDFHSTDGIGIHISGSGGSNTIGGASAGQRNVFSLGTGVRIQSTGSGNTIIGNYFGTWDGENAIASDIGVDVYFSSGHTIENNLIVGHTTVGIRIWGGDYNNVQHGNIIGANRYENAPLPNAVGVLIVEADHNVVWDNLIHGNTGHGVELQRAHYNNITDNRIGYSSFGLGNGGDGIHVFDSDTNVLGLWGGNLIVGNSGDGIWISSGDDNWVWGNKIRDNDQDGVYIEYGQRSQVGGGSMWQRNEIIENGGSGVHLSTGAISTTVRGNHIGLKTGALIGGNNGHGVLIDGGASANRIGGLGASDGNWIGFNAWSGIHIAGATTQDNIVEGNVIGAPTTWDWKAPNGHHGISIYDGAHHNWIGWNNTIVSSIWSGVAIVNGSSVHGSNDNVVWFNRIGANDTGENWGNDYYGVVIANSMNNTTFANQIAYNGQAGVRIDGGMAGNPISANSIHNNSGMGIELVNGGNFELGAPTISLSSCTGQPQTPGLVQGTGCLDCTVEIFSDTADEGRVYEGSTTADASTGAFSWSGLLSGPKVTATSTTVNGETSAFSTPFNVGSCVVPRVFLPVVVR